MMPKIGDKVVCSEGLLPKQYRVQGKYYLLGLLECRTNVSKPFSHRLQVYIAHNAEMEHLELSRSREETRGNLSRKVSLN